MPGGLGRGLGIRDGGTVEEGVGVEGGERRVMGGGKGKGVKRRRSDLSSDGDEGGVPGGGEDEATSSDTLSPGPPPVLGSLHQRRADASPEKFDRGLFDLLLLRVGGKDGRPPAKKARLERKLEITYDETGTPRISSFPSNISRQLGDPQVQVSGQTSQAKFSASTTATSLPSYISTKSPSPLDSAVHSTILLNNSSTPTSSIASHINKKKQAFSLLHAICRDNDLLLHFISYLTLPSLISLYAISKPFHYLFNRHPTACILSNMRTWAPQADTIFPWRCYQSLCVKDPAKRQKKRLEGREEEVDRRWDDLRDVPSLRWLQMVVWREGVSKDCLIQLAVQGLRCPPGTHDAVKVRHPPILPFLNQNLH